MAFLDNSMRQNTRAFQRHIADASIRFRVDSEKDIFSASMKDYSKGGFGFVTNMAVPDNALINIATPAFDFSGFSPIYSSEAKVIWNRIESENGEQPIYMAGGKWLSLTCDWCHERVPSRHLCQTEDSIFLCHFCEGGLEKNLKGQLKTTMHRYLLGNVL